MRTLNSNKTLEQVVRYNELNEQMKHIKKELETCRTQILKVAKEQSFEIDSYSVQVKTSMSKIVDRKKVELALGDRFTECLKDRKTTRLTITNNVVSLKEVA
jgi:hypothetical protein